MSVRLRSWALVTITASVAALTAPVAHAQPDAPTTEAVTTVSGRTTTLRSIAERAVRVPAAAQRRTSTLAPGEGAGRTTAQLSPAAEPWMPRGDEELTVSVSVRNVETGQNGTRHHDYAPDWWWTYWSPDQVNTSWGPAGDRYTWTYAYGDTWTNFVTDPSTSEALEYSSGAPSPRTFTWSSTGDSFVRTSGPEGARSGFVTQSTNRQLSRTTPAGPEYGPPALYPLGGEAYSRLRLSESTSDLVWFPYSGTAASPAPEFTRMGLDRFRPGNPAMAQAPAEALAGLAPTDPEAPTYLAFVGVDPQDPSAGHLYVDHQGSFPERAPVPVADFVAHPECDFSRSRLHGRSTDDTSTRRPRDSIDNPCFRTALYAVTAGSTGRFDTPDVVRGQVELGDMGWPYLSISSRNTTLPLVDAYRISGKNRYEVGVSTSQSFHPDQSADAVIMSGGAAYADALAGGPLAGLLGGPVLLTYPTALHSGVAAEIDRVLAPGGTVYVTGGTASVSAAVESALSKPGRTVKRLGGSNRYAVAVAIAREMDARRGGLPHSAFVAGGTAFADALVAGPAAVHEDGPILLSNGDVLPAATLAYLDSVDGSADFRVYGVGGAGSRAVAPRTDDVAVTGRSRYDVARAVADRFFTGEHLAGLADGRNWPDAVAGGAAMGGQGMPIMLVNGSILPVQTAARISESAAAVDMVLAFGGPASVPDEPLWEAADLGGTQTPLWGPDTGQ